MEPLVNLASTNTTNLARLNLGTRFRAKVMPAFVVGLLAILSTASNFAATVTIVATVIGDGATTNATGANLPTGGSFTLTAEVTGFTPDPNAYQWYCNGFPLTGIFGANSATCPTLYTTITDADTGASHTIVAPGIFTVEVKTPVGEIVASAPFTVTIGGVSPPAPVITTQPASQTIIAGSDVTFTVSVTGTALMYQWQKNGVNIPGATTASYTITKTQQSDAASYCVIVSNPGGIVTSNAAILTVNAAPAITTQAQNVTRTVGYSVTFYISATGNPPPTYQWQVSNNGTTWNNISGATTGTLSFDAVTATMNGSQYRCVVINSIGSITSDPVTLSISTPVTPLTSLPAVAAGTDSDHSLYVTSDGKLWAVGYNHHGQLGDGSTTDRHTPVPVASNVIAIAAAGQHSLYVTNDGELWVVGEDVGPYPECHTPVQVASNIVAVATGVDFGGGSAHSLYVTSDGNLWGMGGNRYGQLGVMPTTDHQPVQMAPNVKAIAAGGFHSLYVTNDGKLWAVGLNNSGQLGLGNGGNVYDGNSTYGYRYMPGQVASNVIAVAAGYEHSLYVTSDGKLWAMGLNLYGALGDGTNIDRSTPEQVASNVTAIAAGDFHSLYLTKDGKLWAMGHNSAGQLGDGTTTDRTTPVQVASNVIAIAAGSFHSLYVTSDGKLWAMGDNYCGQLGDGTTINSSVPVLVASGLTTSTGGGNNNGNGNGSGGSNSSGGGGGGGAPSLLYLAAATTLLILRLCAKRR